MGANQSSKSQLSAAHQASFQQQQQQQQASNKKLSSSLRNVLTSNRLSSAINSTSSNKCKKSESLAKQQQRSTGELIGGGLLGQQTGDSYYISPEVGKSFMAQSGNNGNNNNDYISQSQLMVSATNLEQCKQQSSIYGRSLVPLNGNNYSSGALVEACEMNPARRDGLYTGQDHYNNHNIISRSQQLRHQQQHPTATTTTPQFQLSRAVNTKTSNVLNNNSTNIVGSVAMPNGSGNTNSAFVPTSPSNANYTNNSLSSYQFQHQNNQSPYAQQYLYAESAAYSKDSENQQQYQLRSLFDAPNAGQTTGRRRYKCPQQQYQYLNTLSATLSPKQQQQPHLDFHQYSSKASSNNNRVSSQQFNDHNQLTLDSRNYNRSYSFGSARTLESSGKKNKTHQKLISIFQNHNNSETSDKQRYSNTIHLGDKRRSNLKQFGVASNPGSLKRIKPTPLSAQQASKEAMRTIEILLIKQIAKSCMVSKVELE